MSISGTQSSTRSSMSPWALVWTLNVLKSSLAEMSPDEKKVLLAKAHLAGPLISVVLSIILFGLTVDRKDRTAALLRYAGTTTEPPSLVATRKATPHLGRRRAAVTFCKVRHLAPPLSGNRWRHCPQRMRRTSRSCPARGTALNTLALSNRDNSRPPCIEWSPRRRHKLK